MDFNILIPSIAKTLGMPINTKEQVGELSHALMNWLSKHKILLDGLDQAYKDLKESRDETREIHLEYTTKANTLSLAESVIIELVKGKELSGIVKEKNKKVVSAHGVEVDHINKCLTYADIKD